MKAKLIYYIDRISMKKAPLFLATFMITNVCLSQTTQHYAYYLMVKLNNGKLYSSFYHNLSELKNDLVLEHLNVKYYAGDSSLKLMDDGLLNLNGVEAYIANKKYSGGHEDVRRGIEFEIDTTVYDSTIIRIVMRNGKTKTPLKSAKTGRVLDLETLKMNESNIAGNETRIGKISINMDFPDIHFSDINNKIWESDMFDNKVIVLNFWFVGCKPCIKEIPELNKLANTFKDDGVIFLAFANDNRFVLEHFLEKKKFNYNIIPNSSSFSIQQLGIHNFPTHIIIDPYGKVRFVKSGYSSKSIEDMHQAIRKLLPLIKS